jgi:hypothetical protein
LGLTICETLTGESAFDPALPLFKRMVAMMGPERPAVPSFVRPEVARVIAACWDADPAKRLRLLKSMSS